MIFFFLNMEETEKITEFHKIENMRFIQKYSGRKKEFM